MPLAILAVGIIILFILIVKCKLNSFLSLIFVAIFMGFALGLPVDAFFQAEDGIRDLIVTGVQTCALPISNPKTGALPVYWDSLVLKDRKSVV